MPPSLHCLLTASGSKVWLYECKAMPNLCRGLPSETSEAAEMGSECHLYSESLIREALHIIDYDEPIRSPAEVKKTLKYYSPELVAIAQEYVNKIIEVVNYETKRTGNKPLVLLEQRLEMDYAPDSFGTLDFGCISSDGMNLTIGDLKAGRMSVSKDTPQTKIYALTAYKLYSKVYPIRFIRIFICQPRAGGIKELVLTPEELLTFEREVLIPGAKAALEATEDDATPCDYCKWCLAAKYGKCKKYKGE